MKNKVLKITFKVDESPKSISPAKDKRMKPKNICQCFALSTAFLYLVQLSNINKHLLKHGFSRSR